MAPSASTEPIDKRLKQYKDVARYLTALLRLKCDDYGYELDLYRSCISRLEAMEFDLTLPTRVRHWAGHVEI